MPNRHINCTTVILLFLPAGQLFLYLRIIWIFFFFDLLGAVSGKLKFRILKITFVCSSFRNFIGLQHGFTKILGSFDEFGVFPDALVTLCISES